MPDSTTFHLDPEILIGRSGYEYYDKLPVNYRLATLEDFRQDSKRKIGMRFIIQWATNEDVYQVCEVKMTLTSAILNPFLEHDQVFVKS